MTHRRIDHAHASRREIAVATAPAIRARIPRVRRHTLHSLGTRGRGRRSDRRRGEADSQERARPRQSRRHPRRLRYRQARPRQRRPDAGGPAQARAGRGRRGGLRRLCPAGLADLRGRRQGARGGQPEAQGHPRHPPALSRPCSPRALRRRRGTDPPRRQGRRHRGLPQCPAVGQGPLADRPLLQLGRPDLRLRPRRQQRLRRLVPPDRDRTRRTSTAGYRPWAARRSSGSTGWAR